MNIKNLVSPFLGILMLGFSGCIKPSDYIQKFINEPAIFDYSFSFQPIIETRYGPFLAPELFNDTILVLEDILWTNFEINYKQQTNSDLYTISNLSYQIISYSWVKQGAIDNTDEYDEPIDHVYNEPKRLRNMLFFWFRHKAPKGQTYDYEMLYDPDESSVIPTLYIRAKKTNELTDNDTEVQTCYGFDMSFLENHNSAGTNEARFNVMYYTGKGETGYQSFNNTPMIWWISTD